MLCCCCFTDADRAASKPRQRLGLAARHSISKQPDGPEQAPDAAPVPQPWDAGRPLQGQTQVLVAPGAKPALQALSASQQTGSQASAPQSQQHDVADSAHGSLRLTLDEDTKDVGQSQNASPDTASDPPQEEASEALHQQPSQSPTLSAGADAETVDGDSYQGLPASQPHADSALVKQSGYSLSEDELASVLEADPIEADAAASLPGDWADREQAVPGREQNSLNADIHDAMPEELTNQQPAPQQPSLQDGQSEPMQTASSRPSSPMSEPLGLCIGSPETAGDISVVSAAHDMDVDIEATDDWSTGSQVEVRQVTGSLWAWQSAKLCAPVTPTTTRIKVDYVTKFGSTCKDVSVQQLRPAPAASTYISHPREVDRGSLVEVNLGHGKFVPAIVLRSSRQLQKPVAPAGGEEDGDTVADIAAALAADNGLTPSGGLIHHC